MAYFILIVINILFVYFIRSPKKYFLFSIPLWAILVSSFILWRVQNDQQIEKLKNEYWKTTADREWGDYEKLQKFEKAEKAAQKFNITFVYLIGLQTLITFIFQLIGKNRTTIKLYWFTIWIFGILSFFVFLLIGMMGIVPSTGFVT